MADITGSWRSYGVLYRFKSRIKRLLDGLMEVMAGITDSLLSYGQNNYFPAHGAAICKRKPVISAITSSRSLGVLQPSAPAPHC